MIFQLISLCVLVFSTAWSNTVEIRIANRSNFEMVGVRVGFPSQTEEYGSIPPGVVTEYRAVPKAYRYAYIETTVDGKRAVIQPIDYVGERELKSGKYTYVLTLSKTATSEYDRLRLKCIKD